MSRKNWTEEKLWTRIMTNKLNRTYHDNISILRSKGSKATFDKCVELAKSADQNERIIAVDILSQLGPVLRPPDYLLTRPFHQASNKLFFEMLQQESNAGMLPTILHAIGRNNTVLNTTEANIISLFKHNKDSKIRLAVVFALLGVDNKSAIETMIYLSADKVAHVRDWATFGLGTQTERNNKQNTKSLVG